MGPSQFVFAALLAVLPAQGVSLASRPGVIHFEDGRTLEFRDFRKFRFGTDPGHILLEPRGLYVRNGNVSLHVPVSELREVRVVTYRPAAGTTCQRPCGIAAVRLEVVTTGNLTVLASAGFADAFIVAVDDDEDAAPERQIPWARIGKNGAVVLNVRRITFGHR